MYTGTIEGVKANYALGYDAVCYGMDAIMLIEATKNLVAAVKEN